MIEYDADGYPKETIYDKEGHLVCYSVCDLWREKVKQAQSILMKDEMFKDKSPSTIQFSEKLKVWGNSFGLRVTTKRAIELGAEANKELLDVTISRK